MWIALKELYKQAVVDWTPTREHLLVRGLQRCLPQVLALQRFALYKVGKQIQRFVRFDHLVTTPPRPRRWAFVYSPMLLSLRPLSLMLESVY